MNRHIFPPLILLLSACTPHPNAGRWIGPVTPKAPSPTCEKSRGVLDISANDKVVFAPTEATWLLTGTLTPPATIIATKTQPGADKRPYTTRLDATLNASNITGTYATPRCTYTVDLTRQPQ